MSKVRRVKFVRGVEEGTRVIFAVLGMWLGRGCRGVEGVVWRGDCRRWGGFLGRGLRTLRINC